MPQVSTSSPAPASRKSFATLLTVISLFAALIDAAYSATLSKNQGTTIFAFTLPSRWSHDCSSINLATCIPPPSNDHFQGFRPLRLLKPAKRLPHLGTSVFPSDSSLPINMGDLNGTPIYVLQMAQMMVQMKEDESNKLLRMKEEMMQMLLQMKEAEYNKLLRMKEEMMQMKEAENNKLLQMEKDESKKVAAMKAVETSLRQSLAYSKLLTSNLIQRCMPVHMYKTSLYSRLCYPVPRLNFCKGVHA
jgi:hypothetical protein